MHHCLFDVFWLQTLGYSTYGTLWLEGIFACFKEIETYIIIIMIIIIFVQYNTTRLACKPKLRGMNFESYSFNLSTWKIAKNQLNVKIWSRKNIAKCDNFKNITEGNIVFWCFRLLCLLKKFIWSLFYWGFFDIFLTK